MIKVFVLSGNNKQFSNYVCDLARKDIEETGGNHTVTRTMAIFRGKKYVFLHNPTQLRGQDEYQIQFYGTWHNLKPEKLAEMKAIDSANQAMFNRPSYFEGRV